MYTSGSGRRKKKEFELTGNKYKTKKRVRNTYGGKMVPFDTDAFSSKKTAPHSPRTHVGQKKTFDVNRHVKLREPIKSYLKGQEGELRGRRVIIKRDMAFFKHCIRLGKTRVVKGDKLYDMAEGENGKEGFNKRIEKLNSEIKDIGSTKFDVIKISKETSYNLYDVKGEKKRNEDFDNNKGSIRNSMTMPNLNKLYLRDKNKLSVNSDPNFVSKNILEEASKVLSEESVKSALSKIEENTEKVTSKWREISLPVLEEKKPPKNESLERSKKGSTSVISPLRSLLKVDE